MTDYFTVPPLAALSFVAECYVLVSGVNPPNERMPRLLLWWFVDRRCSIHIAITIFDSIQSLLLEISHERQYTHSVLSGGCWTPSSMVAQQWDAVVFTCPQRSVAQVHAAELRRRQQALERDTVSSLRDSLVLVAEDPDARIGSGGATFNAILVVMEHISSLAGYSVRDSSVLEDKRVLIIHVSGASVCEPCGKSLISTGQPNTIDDTADADKEAFNRSIVLPSVLDRLMEQTDLFLAEAPCGVFTISTETNLALHSESVPSDWAALAKNGVLVFATSVPGAEVNERQGLIVPNATKSTIQAILFPATSPDIQRAADANRARHSSGGGGGGGGDGAGTTADPAIDEVLCFSGCIYLSHRVTEKLMEMCIGHPLNAVSYTHLTLPTIYSV